MTDFYKIKPYTDTRGAFKILTVSRQVLSFMPRLIFQNKYITRGCIKCDSMYIYIYVSCSLEKALTLGPHHQRNVKYLRLYVSYATFSFLFIKVHYAAEYHIY